MSLSSINPMTAMDRLREDLAFAAPEVWMLHIQRRMQEAEWGAAEAALALAREQVKQVPLYEDSHLLDYRAAVLAALGGEK